MLNIKRALPLYIYLGLTCLLIIAINCGPIQYSDFNYFEVSTYLFILVSIFVSGYLLGCNGRLNQKNQHQRSFLLLFQIVKLILLYCVFSCFFKWLSLIVSGHNLNLNTLGKSYATHYTGYVRGQASIDFLYIFNIFDELITFLGVIFSFSFYKDFSFRVKIACVFIILSYVLINLLENGKQKYLGDVMIFFLYYFIMKYAKSEIKLTAPKIMLLFVALLTGMAALTEILSQRYSTINISGENILYHLHPMMYWDENSIILKFFGVEKGFLIGILMMYLSNGVYGLSVCLSLPFHWTYFLGSSYAIARMFELFFKADGTIFENTYIYRAGEKGWGMDKWHSLYSWLASDFTFTGVLGITFFFAYFYGKLWKQIINETNPFAKPLFILLSLGLIFSYSNNQIMHSLQGTLALVIIFIMYLSGNTFHIKKRIGVHS